MPQMTNMINDKVILDMEAIIYSMTLKERCFPALINGSRKRRIAVGSGRNIQEINKLLSQFEKMQKMMKKFKGDKMMKQMKMLQGKLPPELMGKLPPF
jgi:signal recognition particle subunit SRP54